MLKNAFRSFSITSILYVSLRIRSKRTVFLGKVLECVISPFATWVHTNFSILPNFFCCLNLNQAMQLNENVIFLKCDVTMFHMASCRILIAISQSLLVCMLHYIAIYLVIQNRNSTAEALSCRSLGESETLCKFYTVRCFEFSQTFMSGFTVDL